MGNVRYWHKADISSALHMSAFGGKADIGLLRCTLSAFYLKRTFFRGTRACTHKPPQLGHRSLMSACPE